MRNGFAKSEEGNQIIEFAILLPVVIGIIIGSLSLGVGLYAKMVTADAARETARAEAIGIIDSKEKAKSVLENCGFKVSNVYVNQDVGDDKYALYINTSNSIVNTEDGLELQYIDVELTYILPPIIPGVPKLLIGGEGTWDAFHLKAVSSFIKEKGD